MKTESRCRSGEVCTAARSSATARLARPWAPTAGATDGSPPAPVFFTGAGVLTFPFQYRLTRRRAHTVASRAASLLGRCTHTVRGRTGIHRTTSPHCPPSYRNPSVADTLLLPPHPTEGRVRSGRGACVLPALKPKIITRDEAQLQAQGLLDLQNTAMSEFSVHAPGSHG